MSKPSKPASPTAFAAKVDAFLAESGGSRASLAKAIGMPPTTLSNYLLGASEPAEMPIRHFLALTRISRASAAYWLNDKIRTYPPPAVVAEHVEAIVEEVQGLSVKAAEWLRDELRAQRLDALRRLENAASEHARRGGAPGPVPDPGTSR